MWSVWKKTGGSSSNRKTPYPPVYTGTSAPEIVATLKEYGIRTCFYGHLHGNAIRYAVQGDVDGIHYKLVSADGLRFCPYRIN